MTIAYQNLNQVMTPVTAPVLDVVPFAKQINIFPTTSYAAIYLENVLS